MIGRNRASFAAATLLAAFAGFLGGCERSATPSYFSVVRGAVKSVNHETGDLSVDARRRTSRGEIVISEYCLLTKDSEIYINDRFAPISQVLIGDQVELIGCRDTTMGVDRFHVTYAHFNRPLPPAPPPLVAAAPASASRPNAD
jgi:hypothetical protein